MTAWKKLMFPAVGAAVLVVAGVVSGVTIVSQNAQRAEAAATLSRIAGENAELERVADAAIAEATVADLGARTDRIAADTKVIQDLADRTMTWASNAEYSDARESTMRAYGLQETSTFMASFLPPAPITVDAEGNEYAFIDAAGLNSRSGTARVNLLDVAGAVYAYMALIPVTSTSSDGLGSATNIATVFVSVDPAGEVSDLTGFAATAAPLTTR